MAGLTALAVPPITRTLRTGRSRDQPGCIDTSNNPIRFSLRTADIATVAIYASAKATGYV